MQSSIHESKRTLKLFDNTNLKKKRKFIESNLNIFKPDELNSNIEDTKSISNSFSTDYFKYLGIDLGSTDSSIDQKLEISLKLKEKGNILAEQQNYSKALNCWDLAITYNPLDGNLYELKAQVYLLINDPKLAILSVSSAEKAVSLLPDWCEGHLTLARCRLNFGEIELALQSFKTAVSLDPLKKFPEILDEMNHAENLYKSLEKGKADFQLDRDEIIDFIPHLCRTDDGFEEIERCLKNLKTRPGYFKNV
jgi:tetratricopeptide (TPR) repeat protein